MATPDNPFPDKKSHRSKQSYVTGIYNTVGGASTPNQTPLYYDETINASLHKANGEEMSFE